MSQPTIQVEGDGYSAIFYLPEGTVNNVSGARAIVIPVGAAYITEAIRFIHSGRREHGQSLKVELLRPEIPFQSETETYALYTIRNVGEVRAFDDNNRKHAVLRTTAETQKLEMTKNTLAVNSCGNQPTVSGKQSHNAKAVLVHWLGELVNHSRKANSGVKSERECIIHIQVGLSSKLVGMGGRARCWKPADLAKPTVGRIVVVNIGEISDTHRVRKSQSYEAIAVDLLRYLRGDRQAANEETPVLNQLSMSGEQAPPWSMLAVRLNNSAVFLYICEWRKAQGKESSFVEKGAWIVCHKRHCAPIETPELGKMLGFTGFVSAHFASVAFDMVKLKDKELANKAVDSVKSSLAWQRAAYERGCLTMLFKWRAKKWSAKPDYKRLFKELEHEMESVSKRSKAPSRAAEDEVIAIPVDITQAVAHRTPWFMARSSVFPNDGEFRSNEVVEDRFRQLAISWLSEENRTPEDSGIPIVSIGGLKLIDRREVEDFLAIHQALSVYSTSSETKPLNVAVFGAPGVGKSFGVTEVVKYIGSTAPGAFQDGELQFNLGQFKTLNDLPAALHLVRNECLSGKIPIVFFDEFDSTFDGQPFGWLKYLLAPMHDGNFYDNGATYKIGKSVFIFAGGVNRSFEELNGRMRNPSFCEAKGPDFVSRLKVHLNIQGVNKPEDEGDQGRYVLRRWILLHEIVCRRLGLKSEVNRQPLLHRSVAHALLSLERFKHGVRSLESIIKMCTVRPGYPIGPSDLPSMEQMEMHVDAEKLLQLVDEV